MERKNSKCFMMRQLVEKHKESFGKNFDDLPYLSYSGKIIKGAELSNLKSGCLIFDALGMSVACSCERRGRKILFLSRETGLPIPHREYIVRQQGEEVKGKTNEQGMAYVDIDEADCFDIHLSFFSPKKIIDTALMNLSMGEGVRPSALFWSKLQVIELYQSQAPLTIYIDDHAATREAIIRKARQSCIKLITRSDWKARPPKSVDLTENWQYHGIAIHTAGRSFACGSGVLQMQKIQNMHMNERHGADIGYHYAIDCEGNIYEGRDIRFKGEHLSKYNTGIIGVVLLENLMEPGEGNDFVGKAIKLADSIFGGLTPEVPARQVEALKKLITTLQEFFNIKTLGGHREFPRQQEGEGHFCPGNVGIKLVEQIRAETGLNRP